MAIPSRQAGGQTLKFDQIEQLNKKQWRTKGIAKIVYRDGNRSRKMVLDDCKFDRPETEKMLRSIEATLEPSQFVGGRPEPALETAGLEAEGA